MEFIAREVKRSKKKKRLHAFPLDKPDFDSKGFYVKNSFYFMWYYALDVRYFSSVLIIIVHVNACIIKINLFLVYFHRKTIKNEKCW